jgi:hypothetical protein
VIVLPPIRPSLSRRSAANRELALGLVLLALLSAGLVQYSLGFACRGRTSWPCRPADASRDPSTAAITPTLEADWLVPPPVPVLVPPGQAHDALVPTESDLQEWPFATPAGGLAPAPGMPVATPGPADWDAADPDRPGSRNAVQTAPPVPPAPRAPDDTPNDARGGGAGLGEWPEPPSQATAYPLDRDSLGAGLGYP